MGGSKRGGIPEAPIVRMRRSGLGKRTDFSNEPVTFAFVVLEYSANEITLKIAWRAYSISLRMIFAAPNFIRSLTLSMKEPKPLRSVRPEGCETWVAACASAGENNERGTGSVHSTNVRSVYSAGSVRENVSSNAPSEPCSTVPPASQPESTKTYDA